MAYTVIIVVATDKLFRNPLHFEGVIILFVAGGVLLPDAAKVGEIMAERSLALDYFLRNLGSLGRRPGAALGRQLSASLADKPDEYGARRKNAMSRGASSSSSSSSSSIRVGGAGNSMESKVSSMVPVPQGLTEEQIADIKEAFRKAGIQFECFETRPGAYTFSFSVKVHEV